jgi:hypothetical protein
MPGPPNLAQYRLSSTDELVGETVDLEMEGGQPFTLSFGGAGNVSWTWGSGERGSDGCDVVALRPGIFFVAVNLTTPATDGLIVIFERDGAALVVKQRRLSGRDRDGAAVANGYFSGRVTGSSAPVPRPTSDLLGRWHQMRYSDNNLYEHIYLSSDRFCSHNLATENTSGRADCHAVDYWKVAPGLYLVAWRERGSGAAMTVVDDIDQLRSTGIVLHPASPDESVVVPIGGLLQVLRAPSSTLEVEARATVSGWEPGDPI